MKKISKKKVYELIGRMVVFIAIWLLSIATMYYVFCNCITVYN